MCELADVLIGSKQIRYGPRPSPANYRHIEDVINRCRREDRPIRIMSMWGATKGYNRGPIQTADLLDLKALERMLHMDALSHQYHKRGLEFIIFWEDYTERILTGDVSLTYRISLQRIIRWMGMRNLHIVSEAERICNDNYGLRVFQNANAISQGRQKDVGWRGEIAWDYYLERAAGEFPTLNQYELRSQVSLYLGLTLARYQYQILPAHDLKLSFVPYPDCVPDEMRRGRLEHKVKAGKNSNKTAAPWTCFGVIRQDGWTHASIRDVRSRRYKTTNVEYTGFTIPALLEDS